MKRETSSLSGQNGESSSSVPKRRGRPPGSKNKNNFVAEPPVHVGVHEMPRCQNCDSSSMDVLHTMSRDLEGMFHDKPFNHVIWRRCRCRDCLNVQMVKLFLYK